MSTQQYRQSEDFIRNREIWKYKFIDKWTLKNLSDYYHLSPQEIKEAIESQKVYYQEEYA